MLLACTVAAPLAACKQQPAATDPAAGAPVQATVVSFAGGGRDRLCLAGARAAFLTVAADGDRNCNVRGTLAQGVLVPDGDAKCRIAVSRKGDTITLGPVAADCAYYCAAPASFAGKTFVRMVKPEPVTDIAGEPLC